MAKQFAPPEHLSPRAAELWRSVVPDRAKSPGRIAIVQMALEAYDRAAAARDEVERTGLSFVTKSTGAVHVSPCVKVERESRAQFAKLWTDLGFSFSHPAGDRR